jgi:hypothetical protein
MTGEGGQRTGMMVVELGQSITGDCLLRHFGEDTQNQESAKRHPMVGIWPLLEMGLELSFSFLEKSHDNECHCHLSCTTFSSLCNSEFLEMSSSHH